MSDVHDKIIRSKNMAAIKGRNTKPELIVRRMLHKKGFRYRLHVNDLPGKPDLVFPRYEAVIMINGCFWHGHNCHLFKWPGTRKEFWEKKIKGNMANDQKNKITLIASGLRVGIVWECALKSKSAISNEELIGVLSDWLKSDKETIEIQGLIS